MIISVILAYAFKWLGLVDDVLLMIIIISTISLGVVVPTLKEMNIMRTTIGQFILLVAVLADLVTMVLLTTVVSMVVVTVQFGFQQFYLYLLLFSIY